MYYTYYVLGWVLGWSDKFFFSYSFRNTCKKLLLLFTNIHTKFYLAHDKFRGAPNAIKCARIIVILLVRNIDFNHCRQENKTHVSNIFNFLFTDCR